MSSVFPIDKTVATNAALAVTTSVALYATYKLYRNSGKAARAAERENVYETQKLVNEYLVFHYGTPEDLLRYEFGPRDALDFPRRCADLCMQHFKPELCGVRRGLDIGCAVGRSTFELTRVCDEAVGVDYSHAFVRACERMRADKQMNYSILDEGDLYRPLTAQLDHSIDSSKAKFRQGDACDLPHDLGQFGIVLAANLICRLHTPQAFLDRLPSLVAPGGILVITSPYTFLREFTPRKNWLGGFRTEDGTVVTGFDTLKEVLGKDFDLVEDRNMPFFIRETARKNQWTVAHATVWRRK